MDEKRLLDGSNGPRCKMLAELNTTGYIWTSTISYKMMEHTCTEMD